MSAFVSSLPFTGTCQRHTSAKCGRVTATRPFLAPTTPYLASSAFGSPFPDRTNLPKSSNALQMEVTVVVGENEPVESGTFRLFVVLSTYCPVLLRLNLLTRFYISFLLSCLLAFYSAPTVQKRCRQVRPLVRTQEAPLF